MCYDAISRVARGPHLHDLPRLHRQRGEVSSAVDRDALPQDGVQPLHLIPTQHADPPALLRGIGGGHDERTERDVLTESDRDRAAAERDSLPLISGSLIGGSVVWVNPNSNKLKEGKVFPELRQCQEARRAPLWPPALDLGPASGEVGETGPSKERLSISNGARLLFFDRVLVRRGGEVSTPREPAAAAAWRTPQLAESSGEGSEFTVGPV
ncbi:hypothetical protein EYF80_003513 [Liparis tanakae]|uniref:Uncharacterized protein n=1 Tax=Liparis tanakae TaxID=230148 RepID=A0A4Z2J7C1_9TELE|nr:hypothetical protein EYF80_003513 [Liparis tanakae]